MDCFYFPFFKSKYIPNFMVANSLMPSKSMLQMDCVYIPSVLHVAGIPRMSVIENISWVVFPIRFPSGNWPDLTGLVILLFSASS